MAKYLPHIGLRTVKTALAVALALLFADLRGSPAPIFAAIGAIVAMNRTLGDAVQSCLTQFAGILLGAGFGAVFVNLFEGARYFGVAFGIVGLILLCVELKLQFAVPLACIVFVSICLSPADGAFLYGLNRLLDTSIGLGVALVINILLKPYNNRARIAAMLTHFLQSVPAPLFERVVHGRYPDLSALETQLDRIGTELDVFEKQNFPRTRDHAAQAVYLRGCAQLAAAIVQELRALCAMDERGRLSPENAKRLAALGLSVPEELPAVSCRPADVVGNYHLGNLLDAYGYLRDFSLTE